MNIFQVQFQQGNGASKRERVSKVFYDLDGDLYYEVAGGTGFAKCLTQRPLGQQGRGQLADFLEATDVTTLLAAYVGDRTLKKATFLAESAVFSFRSDGDGSVELRRGEDSSLVATLADEGWGSPAIATTHPRVYFVALAESPSELGAQTIVVPGLRSRLSPLAAERLAAQ